MGFDPFADLSFGLLLWPVSMFQFAAWPVPACCIVLALFSCPQSFSRCDDLFFIRPVMIPQNSESGRSEIDAYADLRGLLNFMPGTLRRSRGPIHA